VQLLQDPANLQKRVDDAKRRKSVEIASLKKAVVKLPAERSEARGISWTTRRNVPANADGLRRDGIKRTPRR